MKKNIILILLVSMFIIFLLYWFYRGKFSSSCSQFSGGWTVTGSWVNEQSSEYIKCEKDPLCKNKWKSGSTVGGGHDVRDIYECVPR